MNQSQIEMLHLNYERSTLKKLKPKWRHAGAVLENGAYSCNVPDILIVPGVATLYTK